MTKITGPLFSENASGTIAGFLTFSKRSTGQQVRWQKKQKDAESAGQVAQRADFSTASVACRFFEYGVISFGAALFGAEKSIFDLAAKGKPVSGYNLCIDEFLKI